MARPAGERWGLKANCLGWAVTRVPRYQPGGSAIPDHDRVAARGPSLSRALGMRVEAGVALWGDGDEGQIDPVAATAADLINGPAGSR
jgi:hypothetical protein